MPARQVIQVYAGRQTRQNLAKTINWQPCIKGHTHKTPQPASRSPLYPSAYGAARPSLRPRARPRYLPMSANLAGLRLAMGIGAPR